MASFVILLVVIKVVSYHVIKIVSYRLKFCCKMFWVSSCSAVWFWTGDCKCQMSILSSVPWLQYLMIQISKWFLGSDSNPHNFSTQNWNNFTASTSVIMRKLARNSNFLRNVGASSSQRAFCSPATEITVTSAVTSNNFTASSPIRPKINYPMPAIRGLAKLNLLEPLEDIWPHLIKKRRADYVQEKFEKKLTKLAKSHRNLRFSSKYLPN